MKYKLWLLLSIIILTASCTRDIVLDVGDKPAVVVECVLTDEPMQTLRLSFARTPLQSEAQPLTKATAILKDLTDGSVSGQFSRGEDGLWTLNYAAIPGHHYRLEVGVEGYGPISAEETMPDRPRVRFTDNSSLFQKYGYQSHTTFYLTSSLPEHTFIYGMNYDEETKQYSMAEYIGTDLAGVDNFNLTGKIYDGAIDEVEWEGKYLAGTYDPDKTYIMTYGVLGDLIGISMHRNFLRVQKQLCGEQEIFPIIGSFSDNFIFGKPWSDGFNIIDSDPIEGGYINFMAISDNYDRYLEDAIPKMDEQKLSAMPSIYSHDNIHSNVAGGIGFLGAVSSQKLPWYARRGFISAREKK